MSKETKPYNKKIYLWLQALALTIGSIIGWVTVVREIDYFCDVQGTGLTGITSFTGNITTNPIATPCFWGSIAFVVALVWTIYLLLQHDRAKLIWHQTRLIWLLAGSTIFALSNNLYTFYKYYSQSTGTDYFGCSIDNIGNPFVTACNAGFLAFLLALIFGYLNLKFLKKGSTSRVSKS